VKLITGTKTPLTFFLLLFFCGCDISSPQKVPVSQKNKSGEDKVESNYSSPKIVLFRDERETTNIIKFGQDKTKEFDDLKSPIIPGTPRLPYPSENLLSD
jgi:hypothetical protein